MSPRLDISTGAGEGNNAFGVSRGPSGLTVWNRDRSLQPMGMSRSRGSLDLYALNPNDTNEGWAVYTFKGNGLSFTVYPGALVQADVLLIGGGGSGGGGTYGGGGGAGGFVDKHGVLIYSHEASEPRDLAYPDGEVVVGAGGAAVPWDAVAGPAQQGGDSLMGPQLIAHGGGYGGRNGGISSYPASDGASGGGGRGTDLPYPGQDHGLIGIPGRAIYNQEVPEGGDAKDYEEGHDGGEGLDSQEFGGGRNAGGGGGASWPAHDRPFTAGLHMTGGLGRVCDIRGWYAGIDDPFWRGLYKEAGMTYVDWWAGGGAGKERPNNWSNPDGGNGYRGGGSCGEDGLANTGGGGGGHGRYDISEESEKAPGRAGGSGIVIVRIPMSQKRYVTAPMQATDGNGLPMFNQVWDSYWERFTQVPVYPTGVTYTEIPADEPHIDMRGDAEPAFIWSHLTGPHAHMWGWEFSDFPV